MSKVQRKHRHNKKNERDESKREKSSWRSIRRWRLIEHFYCTEVDITQIRYLFKALPSSPLMGLWGSLVYPAWFGTMRPRFKCTFLARVKDCWNSGQPHNGQGVTMAEERKSLRSTKRFETRYGATTKRRMSDVEQHYRNKRLPCPYCGKKNVKRVFVGIWECSKCDSKFTGKAYQLLEATRTKEETQWITNVFIAEKKYPMRYEEKKYDAHTAETRYSSKNET